MSFNNQNIDAGPANNSINQLIGGISRSSLQTNIPMNRNQSNAIYIDSQLPNGNYIVRWINTGEYEELPPDDISDHAKMVHREVTKHNQTVAQLGNTVFNRKAIIYTRISNPNETPIDTQLYYCADYARRNGILLHPFGYLVDNGISGRKGNNLENGELNVFKDYIEPNTLIIMNSIDRLSRHTSSGINFLESMASKNIYVYFVTEQILWSNDMDTGLKRRVRDSLSTAEEFSDIISDKIKRNIQMRRAQGHYIGRAEYGYKTQKINNIMKKVKVRQEIDIIKLLVNYVDEQFNQYGKPRYDYVVNQLKNNRYFNRNGKAFNYTSVARLYKKYKNNANSL